MKSRTVVDVAFDDAADVGSVRYRLHPLDVGFDLRAEGIAVKLADETELRVSYPSRDGSRRVMRGPRASVVARLRRLGFLIAVVERSGHHGK